MRLSCPECGENLIVLGRPSKAQHKNPGQIFNVVYCICKNCGERAKADILISSKKHLKRYDTKFFKPEELNRNMQNNI